MKTVCIYFLLGLGLMIPGACKQVPDPTNAGDNALRSIGWLGDDRAARIFQDSLGYLVFGSTNSFAPGTYDGIILRLNDRLELLSYARFGKVGDEMLLGAEPIANTAGKTVGYVAWGTVQEPGKSDKDLWFLFTDGEGKGLVEQRIALSTDAVDDIPVSVQVAGDALLIACKTARRGAGGMVETACWLKTDLRGNERWRCLLQDSTALKADGIFASGTDKARALCHTEQGEIRVLEITDPVTPADTPAWQLLTRRTESGLKEGGVWLPGPDNSHWFYASTGGTGREETRLLRFTSAGQFIDSRSVGDGPFERNGLVCLHPGDNLYPVKLLSTRRLSAGSAQTQIGVYFCAQNGIKVKEPMFYGGSFINSPADIIRTRDGKLLLLGNRTAPNKAGADLMFFLLNEGGELP